MLGVLQPIWGRIPETASRLRGRIEAVLDYAKANGLRSGENPASWRGHLALILPKRQKLSRGHHQAMRRLRTLLSWSSGKDSAWTLQTLRTDPRYHVVGLVTTVNAAADRVAMHAVRTELLRAQARATGLDLWELAIPHRCSNEEYESAMLSAIARAEREAIDCFSRTKMDTLAIGSYLIDKEPE